MKALIIYTSADGKATAKDSGNPSELVRKVRAIRKASDFPKGAEKVEVWTRSQGVIKAVSKSKLENQEKSDAKKAPAKKAK